MKKMKLLYVVWAILIVTLVAILTYVGFIYKNKLKPYKDLEVNLIEYGKKYVELKFLYPDAGEVTTISVEDMINENVIEALSYEDEVCTGYVELTYNGVYNYESFIKCDNYTTKGYKE